MEDKLEVTIQGREGVLFEGPALRVSSVNGTGDFDILPRHANFISLINDHIDVVPVGEEVRTFPVDNGVLRVLGDKVEVYLGIKQK